MIKVTDIQDSLIPVLTMDLSFELEPIAVQFDPSDRSFAVCMHDGQKVTAQSLVPAERLDAMARSGEVYVMERLHGVIIGGYHLALRYADAGTA